MTTNFFPARPSVYCGTPMRSRLEATFAARLDQAGLAWRYEPRCYADATRQYLPDFEVHHPDRISFEEVKAVVADPIPILTRMAVIWKSEPEAKLVLWVLGDAAQHWEGFDFGRGMAVWNGYDDTTGYRIAKPIFMEMCDGSVIPISPGDEPGSWQLARSERG